MRSGPSSSTSSAQVDGQSCGQAEWPVLMAFRDLGVLCSSSQSSGFLRPGVGPDETQLAPGTMNYDHAYHAGNFADVVKHATVCADRRIPEEARIRLFASSTRMRVAVRLRSELGEAQKTGEWRDGIGRVLEAILPPRLRRYLRPISTAVRKLNPGGDLKIYPGSPEIIRATAAQARPDAGDRT
jgi:hypothetical protein